MTVVDEGACIKKVVDVVADVDVGDETNNILKKVRFYGLANYWVPACL